MGVALAVPDTMGVVLGEAETRGLLLVETDTMSVVMVKPDMVALALAEPDKMCLAVRSSVNHNIMGQHQVALGGSRAAIRVRPSHTSRPNLQNKVSLCQRVVPSCHVRVLQRPESEHARPSV